MKRFIYKNQLLLSFAVILTLSFLCASTVHAVQKRSNFADDCPEESSGSCSYPDETCSGDQECWQGCCYPNSEEEISGDGTRLNNPVFRNGDVRPALEFNDYDFTSVPTGEL